MQKETGITEIKQFDARGNCILTIDGEGHSWTAQYDHLNRPVIEIEPKGSRTTWSYQNDTIICGLPDYETTIQRFEAGKCVESLILGWKKDLISYTRFETYPEISAAQEIKEGITTKTYFNTLGQPLRIETGQVITHYHYDACGNPIATIDGKQQTTSHAYDPWGRLITKTLPDGAELTYAYDPDSNLTTFHLPGGLIWRATYDEMGRKTSEKLEVGEESNRQWEYTYENGHIKQAKDPLDRLHHYSYDLAGRLIRETIDKHTRTFTYDARGLLILAEELGDDSTTVKRSYDSTGRLTGEKITLNTEVLQNTHQTWSPGKRTLQIGHHQRHFYTQAGHLQSLETTGMEFAYAYATSGLLIQRANPFYSTHLSYNDSGLPKNITTKFLGASYKESLQWDKTGKLSNYQADGQTPVNKRFNYTPRGQLRSTGSDHFEFDFGKPGRGIRTAAPESKIAPNGLDPFGKILTEESRGKILTTTYDKIGQISTRTLDTGEENYKWDPWGRLIGISSNHFTWKASYDPFGRRLQTIYQEEGKQPLCITSLYDPETEFQEIGVVQSGRTLWKIYGNDTCEALIDETGQAIGLIYDTLNNLVTTISSEQATWNDTAPSPYGFLPLRPLDSSLLGIAKSLAWQSRSIDPTGFIWMGARTYDPASGRFLSPDPIGYPFCHDLYAYANGDPINFNDPDGRFASAVYDTVAPKVISTFNDHRVQGGMRALGGLTEAAIGATFGTLAAPSGVGLIGGGLLVAHGLDNYQAGCYQAFNGRRKDTCTVRALRTAGMSHSNASLTSDAISIFGTAGAGTSLQLSRAAQTVYPSLASTKFMPREKVFSSRGA